MQRKMLSFLHSIGIEDVESFDMDFTLAGRNAHNPAQIDMFIQKESPWDYAILDRFVMAVSNVQYPYSMRLSYVNEITPENVLALYQDYVIFHLGQGEYPEMLMENGTLVAEIHAEKKEKEEKGLNDFLGLLSFIQYPTAILRREVAEVPAAPVEEAPPAVAEEGVEKSAQEQVASAPVEAPVEAVAESPAEKPEEALPEKQAVAPMSFALDEGSPTLEEQGFQPVEEVKPMEFGIDGDNEPVSAGDSLDGKALIQADLKAAQAEGEEEMLAQMQENLKAMMEDRRRARLRKIGDYRIAEKMDDIFHMPLGNVDFVGEVFEADVKTTKRGGKMGVFGVGDPTNAITVRCFAGTKIPEETMTAIGVGTRLRVRGAIDVDTFTHQKNVRAHFLDMLPPAPLREDDPNLEGRRVELHLHTNMSTMDAIPDFKKYYKLAKNMGMKAIAVTDHGVVQAFPAAQDARDSDKKDPLKIIFGCELNMFDMEQSIIFNPSKEPLAKARYCVFDTETTGLSARYDRLVEFGGVIIEGGMVVKRFDTLINPQMPMPIGSSSVNHITDDMLADKPTIHELLPTIMEFLGDNILVAHNATFDVGFINAALEREGLPPLKNAIVDTLPLSHYFFPNAGRHNEGALLRNLGLQVYDESDAHRADYDANALNEGWSEMVRRLDHIYPGITHEDLGKLQVELPDIDDVEREKADEGNYARFLRAMGKFSHFWHLQYPKDDIQLNYSSYEEAHAEYRRWMSLPEGVKPTDEEQNKPTLYVHLEKMKEAFNSFCRNIKEYHTTVLVKNTQGLKDLYKIVTQANTTYLGRVPKTPRALIETYRENMLVGSACFNSEIFEIASTRNLDVLVNAMKFYDYIEIQPLENYSYLLHMERVQSKEHLLEILRDIVTAAHMAGKKVVATGDCHYVNPEDKILRDVYIDAKAIGGGAHPLNPPARKHYPVFENPDQHFRSTREMLDCMQEWMSPEEAREVVIDNSNWVADQIEDRITPVSKDVFAPNENIPNSAGQLRDLCYGTFKRDYEYTFDDDPKVKEAYDFVKARLDRELEGIIGHGYAVTYFIAHKLIKMAGEEPEHFIVGSRGSVGSSFAATMAEITEVNALPPHYHCPHCHYLTFKDEDGVEFLKKGYKSGFDLPDKVCPKCGHKLKQNGQNIPFETFLGFSAEKVPDIDLNFEDESQHRAHNYTRILLGPHNVFRAGTIETVAEKTAYGYVRGYFENLYERQGNGKTVDDLNPTYIAYLASKCQGVKRTTGQHPGGIVVVPSNMSVYDFTAVQHPADDLHSDWLTTHYDFHSMHDEILKFDILGHVDPMAMRYYRDLTKIHIEDIPMNDPKVLSLFTSPKELHLHRNYLNQTTGALALPEFGTETTNRVLVTAQPKTFNDLLIISGISHGTDVWSGNAEDLITSGVTTLNGVIGCRDDIMSYLILQGVDPSMSFKTMEFVRKNKAGKPLPDNMVDAMKKANVPDWYIDSCRKIKYLFPRGHATAYVMMAVRVAYFKLYYPLEFYSVFFSIRCDAYEIETMVKGEDAIIARIDALKARRDDRANPLSNKETNILKTLTVALEMAERGYKFTNIDLYKSDYKMFRVDHENKALIPPFIVVDQLGENAGKSVVEARERLGGKPFLSKEQLLRETKLSSTNVNDLDKLGALPDLSETNQLTLF